jgi:dihydroorotase
MAKTILFQNCTLVNEGKSFVADVLIDNGIIQKIGTLTNESADSIIASTFS